MHTWGMGEQDAPSLFRLPSAASSQELPFDGEQSLLLNLLLQLDFKLGDEVVALCFDFVLTGKQFAPELTALGFELPLALLMGQLFFEGG
jgi:hypothetical protein